MLITWLECSYMPLHAPAQFYIQGVVYTHRSTYLHALTLCLPDAIGISENDMILPVVSMFHVFSWGFPFSAAFMGANLVFGGSDFSAKNLCSLVEQEKVTLMAGVPPSGSIFCNTWMEGQNTI